MSAIGISEYAVKVVIRLSGPQRANANQRGLGADDQDLAPAEAENHDQERQAGDQVTVKSDFNDRVVNAQQLGEHVHDGEHEKRTHRGDHAANDVFTVDKGGLFRRQRQRFIRAGKDRQGAMDTPCHCRSRRAPSATLFAPSLFVQFKPSEDIDHLGDQVRRPACDTM